MSPVWVLPMSPVYTVVPSEVAVCKRFGERRLSALVRAGKERHLTVVANMLGKNRLIDALDQGCVFRGGQHVKNAAAMQCQTDRYVRMVDTKLTDASEWYIFSQHGKDCALHLSP